MVASLIVGQSAGVYLREDDESSETLGINTSIGVMVFPSKKGSLIPTRRTSFPTFTQDYGLSDTAWGNGHLSAAAFFEEGSQLWCLRVPGTNAKFAGASLCYSAATRAADELIGISAHTSVGTFSGFDVDPIYIYNTLISRALTAGSISGSISGGGATVSLGPVAYSTSQTATFTNLTLAINTALTTLRASIIALDSTQTSKAPGSATLLNAGYGIIKIVAPEGIPLTITFTVTGNTAATTLAVAPSNLIDIYAENPGDWGNDIGYNITDIDPGVFQRINFVFSGPLATGNIVTISLVYNGSPLVLGPITLSGTADSVMADISALFVNALYGGVNTNGAVSVAYPGGYGSGNARTISVVAPVSGPDIIKLISYSITGGSSQPSMYFNETMSGVASTGAFTLNIFKRSNLRYPYSSYRGTLTPTLDGYNDQLFLEEVINESDKKSKDIRVVVNQAMVAAGITISTDPGLTAQFATVQFLGGGNNGSLPTNGQISAAWDTFLDNELYPFSIMINAGFTDAAIHQKMASIAESRKDAIAILDVPADSQAPDDAYNWRTQECNVNTSYAAFYSPDIKILDTNSNQRIWVPQSGYVAARYVYTDSNFATWFAPAGYNRGRLTQALDFRYNYSKPDRDILDGVQINCGKHAADGSGRLIFGENTAQVTPSLLSSVAVRRSLIFIENSIARSVERHLFDQNSSQLGFLIRKEIEKFLQPIKDGQGIKNFLVRCDASNNPAVFADAGQLNISVYIIPLRPVKIILLDTIIVPSSITFNEFIVNGIF